MATRTYDAPLSDMQCEAAITLSSTVPGYLNVIPGYRGVKLYCASDWKLLLTPRIHRVFYYAAAGTYTDYTSEAIDKSTTTHVPLDAMAADDYLYIGCKEQFLGLYFNIGTNVNAETATLDVEYWKTQATPAWADVTGDADGTDSTGTSTGATLEQDGVYTWTLPSDWIMNTVNGKEAYWIRFCPSTALSATVDVLEMMAVHKNTNYAWMEGGMVEAFNFDDDKVGGIQYLSVDSTPTLHVTWLKYEG
ncbi:MAG: hypothetical protein WC359_14025 [Dehalococcoidia bacterium]|jgi:hypothetical protein